MTTGTLQSYSG